MAELDLSFIEDENVRSKVEESVTTVVKTQMEDLKASMSAEFSKQVEGLKKKNDELLNEKKTIQKRFEGIEDPAEALEALKLITENDDIRMIKEGKFEEVIERKTSQIKSDYEAQIMEVAGELEKYKGLASDYQSRFESKVIDDSIREAAIKAKVRPEALEDILNKGRMIFSLGEDGTVEARSKKDNKLLKTEDDKILTTFNWMENLKSTSPHYWPPSKGGGYEPDLSNMDDLDRRIASAAQEGDSDLYRKLRKQKREALGK